MLAVEGVTGPDDSTAADAATPFCSAAALRWLAKVSVAIRVSLPRWALAKVAVNENNGPSVRHSGETAGRINQTFFGSTFTFRAYYIALSRPIQAKSPVFMGLFEPLGCLRLEQF